MTRTNLMPWALATTAALVIVAPTARAGLVDIFWAPEAQTVARCDIVEIQLVTASDDDAEQPFNALDAIVSWNPARLEFIELVDSGAPLVFSGFPPDQDGINDDIFDGEALYTALGQPTNPPVAPPAPDRLIVTTFRFRAIALTPGTEVKFIPTVGDFGRTRVLFGGDVTGDITGTSTTMIGTCQGDTDANGFVEFDDLLVVLSTWGPCPDCCPGDVDGDNEVDFDDLLIVLSQWGPCP